MFQKTPQNQTFQKSLQIQKFLKNLKSLQIQKFQTNLQSLKSLSFQTILMIQTIQKSLKCQMIQRDRAIQRLQL
jgi:hypothetical protein